MKDYRTCVVCRKQYSFCPKCGKDKDKPLWLFTFCSEECKNIYETMSLYENNEISANDAKDKLDKLKFDDESLVGSYRETFKKIKSSLEKEEMKKENNVELDNLSDSKKIKAFRVSKKELDDVEQ